MQQISNLDCFFLAREMHGRLAGAFFENFYDYGNGVFRLRFSTKESVLIDLKGFAFIAESFPEPPRQPSSFAMLLRKHLGPAKLVSAKQLDFDRILEFEFSSSKEGAIFLTAELFGKQGNILLLDGERKIVQPFKREAYAARRLAPHEEYVLPPSEKKHPLELKPADFEGKGKIVSFLSQKTSLAPFYLEEACARAGVGLDEKAEELGEKQKTALLGAIKSLFAKPLPSVFIKEEKPFAFASVEMRKFAESKTGCMKTESLSKAIEAYYSAGNFQASAGAKTKPAGGDVEFQLKTQEELLKGFESRAEERQKEGKWVFENHELVESLLKTARENPLKLGALAAKRGLKVKAEKQFLEIEV